MIVVMCATIEMNSTVRKVKMNACKQQMNSSSNVSMMPPMITENSTP